MVNVLTAIRTVDPDLINLARSFKATRAQIFWKIEFPASMPPLFAGLRIGSTLAVVGVVVGEFVGGNLGLGFLLTFGEGQANTPMVFVSIVLLTVIGSLAYLAVVLTEQRVLHYLPAREHRLYPAFRFAPCGLQLLQSHLLEHQLAEHPVWLGQRLDEIEMIEPAPLDVAHATPAVRSSSRDSARLTAELGGVEFGGGDDERTGQAIEV